MLSHFSWRAALALLAAACTCTPALSQLGGPPPPDPLRILQLSKAASGGAAWDAVRSQHSSVTIQAAGLVGSAERWSDTLTGASRQHFSIGSLRGVTGFDGTTAWSQDEGGVAMVADDVARELAINAAFRDRFAFWYPDRGRGEVSYSGRVAADDANFDVVRITPEGGRPFELWINVETRLIERLVEREERALRTEIYMDLRDIDGVKIPFRVRAMREVRGQDEVFVVDSMDFNRPLKGISFTPPPSSTPAPAQGKVATPR